MLLFIVYNGMGTADGGPTCHGRSAPKTLESDESYKRRVGPYTRAVPGMHRAGPSERGGGSYGRRTVATSKRAAMQISETGKGLIVIVSELANYI